ncbi:MAG TPA: hypothetical protein VH331_04530 [Allosphingosinicella sp.]|jgi:hypothetical protein|nr:hypothetical protein [Allosphingosinicella sp.]
MAREPSYPKDAPVTPAKGDAAPSPKPTPRPEPRSDKGAAENKGDSKRTKHLMAGAAIGIGSAAIVAALLYANRKRDRS